MFKVTFFSLLFLSALFAIGFLAIMGMFSLVYKSQGLAHTPVKAADILAREGYTAPPRTRRRKVLARDLAYV